MKIRLTAILLTVLFLWGTTQLSAQPKSSGQSYELKIVAPSFVKSVSSENSLGEDEFTHNPVAVLLNFKTTFILRAAQRPGFTPSYTHKPSRVFILFRVLRN
jgi:hypothetical protein